MKFIIQRQAMPSWFTGMNEWGPTWSQDDSQAIVIDTDHLLKTLQSLADHPGRLGCGGDLRAIMVKLSS